MQNKYTLGIIGAGNMAYAIVGGILSGGLLSPADILISDPSCSQLEKFRNLGVNVTSDNTLPATACEYLLFAVKPQAADTVFESIKDVITAPNVLSIMAGISISSLKNALGNRNYARIMPNTPALVGKGMSAVAFDCGYHSEFILNIFRSVGEVAELDESLFDAVTSLSGSGPAYAYMFIKALIDGGMDGGLDFETSKTLALQTVIGATEMIKNSSAPIDELINAVCSKGGTTIQAVNSFIQDGLEDTVRRGMEKCRLRSIELGKENH